MKRPSAEEQIVFLQKMQRIFAEGEFASTYKFALILALAELAVECNDDTGNSLSIPLQSIGEKIAELYWRQTAEYGVGQEGSITSILLQNYGAQAAVVNHLRKSHRQSSGKISIARQCTNEWSSTIKAITSTVRQMPLRYLQVVGGKLDPFLYDLPCPRGAVLLKAGVAFNFRRYQGLIQHLARAGWIEHIRGNRLNLPMLGKVDDLETFMFGSKRAQLNEVAKVLLPIQDSCCFYCDCRIDRRAEVDHFIPWVRYPRDTAHNFVLACSACNNSKRDLLAGESHLEAWMERFQLSGMEIGERLAEMGFVANEECSIHIAHWAYSEAIEMNGIGWISRGRTELLKESCIGVF